MYRRYVLLKQIETNGFWCAFTIKQGFGKKRMEKGSQFCCNKESAKTKTRIIARNMRIEARYIQGEVTSQ